jgi:hypothetical protein
MINPSDYNITIGTTSDEAVIQTKYDIFALIHKVAYDNFNEERIFSKYAYDKVVVVDPAQAAQYASFMVDPPTMASMITDSNALYAYILDINSNVPITP